MAAPRICFNSLRGFPTTFHNGKIKIEEFLVASQEIITLMESFGRLFTPVINDMQNNHDKIKKYLENSTSDIEFLEDLILDDLKNPHNSTKLSLLWLKRALEMLQKFFAYLLEDEESQSEDLKMYLRKAYTDTLQPFHGFLLQKTFNLLAAFLPSRTTLFGAGDLYRENIVCLQKILPTMKVNIDKISQFYEENQLDDLSKV